MFVARLCVKGRGWNVGEYVVVEEWRAVGSEWNKPDGSEEENGRRYKTCRKDKTIEDI